MSWTESETHTTHKNSRDRVVGGFACFAGMFWHSVHNYVHTLALGRLKCVTFARNYNRPTNNKSYAHTFLIYEQRVFRAGG